MPKNLICQRRGKGSIFRAKSFKAYEISYKDINYIFNSGKTFLGQVVDIIEDNMHSAPIAKILLEDFNTFLNLAVDGLQVDQKIEIGENVSLNNGNITMLKNLPVGTIVCNIQSNNKKLARASGTFARIEEVNEKNAILLLPSGKRTTVSSNAIATIGKIANSGRTTKPFVHAGQAYHKYKSRHKKYPHVGGVSMNAYDHPHGGKEPRLGKPTTVSRNAPPGRKVGHIAARRTGKKKKG
ncbi:MAG: 50S ribosomal protein L2 [Candidatus Altarchaeaceae archaeon]